MNCARWEEDFQFLMEEKVPSKKTTLSNLRVSLRAPRRICCNFFCSRVVVEPDASWSCYFSQQKKRNIVFWNVLCCEDAPLSIDRTGTAPSRRMWPETRRQRSHLQLVEKEVAWRFLQTTFRLRNQLQYGARLCLASGYAVSERSSKLLWLLNHSLEILHSPPPSNLLFSLRSIQPTNRPLSAGNSNGKNYIFNKHEH